LGYEKVRFGWAALKARLEGLSVEFVMVDKEGKAA
jgi:hypothetical protein